MTVPPDTSASAFLVSVATMLSDGVDSSGRTGTAPIASGGGPPGAGATADGVVSVEGPDESALAVSVAARMPPATAPAASMPAARIFGLIRAVTGGSSVVL